METVKEYSKAILGFLALLATNMATDLMRGEEFWPSTPGEILRWAITSIAGTWLIYQIPNALQAKQVDRYLKQKGLRAVPEDEILPPAPDVLP